MCKKLSLGQSRGFFTSCYCCSFICHAVFWTGISANDDLCPPLQKSLHNVKPAKESCKEECMTKVHLRGSKIKIKKKKEIRENLLLINPSSRLLGLVVLHQLHQASQFSCWPAWVHLQMLMSLPILYPVHSHFAFDHSPRAKEYLIVSFWHLQHIIHLKEALLQLIPILLLPLGQSHTCNA